MYAAQNFTVAGCFLLQTSLDATTYQKAVVSQENSVPSAGLLQGTTALVITGKYLAVKVQVGSGQTWTTYLTLYWTGTGTP